MPRWIVFYRYYGGDWWKDSEYPNLRWAQLRAEELAARQGYEAFVREERP